MRRLRRTTRNTKGSSVKAVQYRDYGGPEVLEVADIPDPKMFIDLVLVRIEAAALNPADLGFQSGVMDPFVDSFFPVTPGWDLAGVVEQAGAATTGFRPGDEVIGYVRGQAMSYGTYAEKISAEPRQLVRKPKNLSWAQAAGLPVAGLTAYQAIVHSLGVTAGDTVLVHGASGGVGHLAVQIALARGARVLGTGSEASQAFIESLGATPVRYGDELVEQVLKAAPDGVDAVLDTAGRGSLATTKALAAPGARVASITRSTTEHEGAIDVFLRLDGDDFTRLVELAEEGKLTVHVDRTFPLGQAAEAQRLLAGGHARGKIVLENRREA
jgi:NADPH:quinone reductase-like Zn-dependent oxidoreductase